MIILSGDTHGDIDLQKILSLNDSKLTRNDYLIILGDVGYCWYGDKRDELVQNLYNSLNCTVLLIDGNHENFNALNSFPVQLWHGGKVHKLSNNVYHLMRGQIFTIDNQSFFVMGGASSIDKAYRKENISWWHQEMPSLEEYQQAEENLEKVNWKVDYVLTHTCGPRTLYKINPIYSCDMLNQWFRLLETKLDYKHWFFGHYHFDKQIDEQHTCLYQKLLSLC